MSLILRKFVEANRKAEERIYGCTSQDLYVLCSGYNVGGVIFAKHWFFYLADYNIYECFNHQNMCSRVKLWYTTCAMASKFVTEVRRILYYRLYDKSISCLQGCLVQF